MVLAAAWVWCIASGLYLGYYAASKRWNLALFFCSIIILATINATLIGVVTHRNPEAVLNPEMEPRSGLPARTGQ